MNSNKQESMVKESALDVYKQNEVKKEKTVKAAGLFGKLFGSKSIKTDSRCNHGPNGKCLNCMDQTNSDNKDHKISENNAENRPTENSSKNADLKEGKILDKIVGKNILVKKDENKCLHGPHGMCLKCMDKLDQKPNNETNLITENKISEKIEKESQETRNSNKIFENKNFPSDVFMKPKSSVMNEKPIVTEKKRDNSKKSSSQEKKVCLIFFNFKKNFTKF